MTAHVSNPLTLARRRCACCEIPFRPRAELVLSAGIARCEWQPEFPNTLRGQRRRKFLAAYRAWRDECLGDFAQRTGLHIVVLEL